MVASKQFRKDLFYRLDNVRIEIPPLRRRREDVPALFRYFLDSQSDGNARPDLEVDLDVIELVSQEALEGNVRQLQNIASYCSCMCTGNRLRVSHLPLTLLSRTQGSRWDRGSSSVTNMIDRGLTWEQILAKLRLQAANHSLSMAELKDPNASKQDRVDFAARRLQVSPRSIYEWQK
jgi:DNA-binding NtrC family response regulator